MLQSYTHQRYLPHKILADIAYLIRYSSSVKAHYSLHMEVLAPSAGNLFASPAHTLSSAQVMRSGARKRTVTMWRATGVLPPVAVRMASAHASIQIMG